MRSTLRVLSYYALLSRRIRGSPCGFNAVVMGAAEPALFLQTFAKTRKNKILTF